jgi:hypothetical protein
MLKVLFTRNALIPLPCNRLQLPMKKLLLITFAIFFSLMFLCKNAPSTLTSISKRTNAVLIMMIQKAAMEKARAVGTNLIPHKIGDFFVKTN